MNIVAQCSATPASVAATRSPPCSATPFQRQLDVRHSWPFKGDRCDRAFLGGCSAILLLHLKKPQDSEEICCDTCSSTVGPRTRVQLWAFCRDIFYIFSLLGGGGRESPRRREGGGSFFKLKSQDGRRLQQEKSRGAGRVSAANWGFLGGGVYQHAASRCTTIQG